MGWQWETGAWLLWKLFPGLLFLQNHGNTTTINETPFSDKLNIWTMQRENLQLLFVGKRFCKVIYINL